MNRFHLFPWRFVLTGSMLLAGSITAIASPCVVGSLQSYVDLDQSGCSIAAPPDNTFYDFRFSSSFTGNATVANASEITVTPIDTTTAFGLEFSASANGINLFSTPAGSSVTYHIEYTVDPLTGGPDLSLDPVTGNVTATQTYCVLQVASSGSGCSGGVSLSQTVDNSNPPASLSSYTPWPVPPTSISQIDVNTTITLTGPASFDALDSTFSIVTSTSGVPEPANLLLAGFGLSLLLVLIYAERRFALRGNKG